jgi:predicted O-methyltransferase YrrM
MSTTRLPPELAVYVQRQGLREHPEATALRERTRGMPGAGMQISPEQGAFLNWLARTMGVRRAIEVGTFTGYSALVVALALPTDGKLIACDISAEWTAIGQPFWQLAGVADRIDLRIAPAADSLASLLADGGAGRFDFCFIDADKSGYDGYYEAALRLVRPGGAIAIDNVLWGGRVAEGPSDDPDTAALQRLNAKIQADPRVDMTMLPIADGLTLARVLA